jgi:hypothetical protein
VGRHLGFAIPLVHVLMINKQVRAALASVKAAVQSVKLPAYLFVSDSRPQKGLQKADQPLLGMIQKNARFCETRLKLHASAPF